LLRPHLTVHKPGVQRATRTGRPLFVGEAFSVGQRKPSQMSDQSARRRMS
jgi:hypothetical protein